MMSDTRVYPPKDIKSTNSLAYSSGVAYQVEQQKAY